MPGPGNFMGGALQGGDVSHEVRSPVTGEVIDRVGLAAREEIAAALEHLAGPQEWLAFGEVFEFLERLRHELVRERDEFLRRTILETGFVTRDATEIVDGAIEFLGDFAVHVHEGAETPQVYRHSYSSRSHRDMRIVERPYRCVAAIVPQNASLTLSIIILASALYAGSKVLMRPSLQNASTGGMLARALARSEPPGGSVAFVNSLASDFLEACYASEHVDLIHYIGSNRYALEVFRRAFAAGKTCLIDGQGNGLLYVDEGFPCEEAVALITEAATRYNGETCTSVNGVLVEESQFEAVRDALTGRFGKLRAGSPFIVETDVGPLFSEEQAADLRLTLEGAGARVLCGGAVEGAFFTPAVVAEVDPTDPLVREGFLGPAVWVHPVRLDALWDWLRANRFPLSDTILSRRREVIRAFATNSKAARICVNEDPSIESMFEPWGGYPPSGHNPVTVWTRKYRQAYQLDGRLRDIIRVPSDQRKVMV